MAPRGALVPLAHAERLAALLPDARLVEIEDAWAFIPLDQPAATAAAISDFLADTCQAAFRSPT